LPDDPLSSDDLLEAVPAVIVMFDHHGVVTDGDDRPEHRTVVRALGARWLSFGPAVVAHRQPLSIAWQMSTAEPTWRVTRAAHRPGDETRGDSVVTVTIEVDAADESGTSMLASLRHDAVTGLPNASLLTEVLDAASRQVGRADQSIALAVVDLDGFAAINEAHGHLVGDRVLRAAAEAILAAMRVGDQAFRLGDDEFALLFGGAIAPEDARVVAGRVVASIGRAGSLMDPPLLISASVGLSHHAECGRAADLVEEAAAAAEVAKAAGGARLVLLDADSPADPAADRRRVAALRESFTDGSLVLALQPIVSMASGLVVGAEALARWSDPAGELEGPERFVPLAEQTGMICDLTDRVVEMACIIRAGWDAEGVDRDARLSVNVSAADLTDVGFPDRVARIAERAGTSLSGLRFELTETSVVTDSGRAIGVLEDLRDRGASIALDDFGTGYASLTLLRTLPLDVVKIDQAFVSGLPDEGDAAVVRLVLDLADELGLAVTAEGIETEEQFHILRQLGCTMGQGFLLARPSMTTDFASLSRSVPMIS